MSRFETVRDRYQLETDAIYINFRLNNVFMTDPNFKLNWRVDEKVEYLIQQQRELEKIEKTSREENTELQRHVDEEKGICERLQKQNEELRRKVGSKLDEMLEFSSVEIHGALGKIRRQQNYVVQELKQQGLQQTEEKTRRVKEMQTTVRNIAQRNEQVL